jgi:hypothetical protein
VLFLITAAIHLGLSMHQDRKLDKFRERKESSMKPAFEKSTQASIIEKTGFNMCETIRSGEVNCYCDLFKGETSVYLLQDDAHNYGADDHKVDRFNRSLFYEVEWHEDDGKMPEEGYKHLAITGLKGRIEGHIPRKHLAESMKVETLIDRQALKANPSSPKEAKIWVITLKEYLHCVPGKESPYQTHMIKVKLSEVIQATAQTAISPEAVHKDSKFKVTHVSNDGDITQGSIVTVVSEADEWYASDKDDLDMVRKANSQPVSFSFPNPAIGGWVELDEGFKFKNVPKKEAAFREGQSVEVVQFMTVLGCRVDCCCGGCCSKVLLNHIPYAVKWVGRASPTQKDLIITRCESGSGHGDGFGHEVELSNGFIFVNPQRRNVLADFEYEEDTKASCEDGEENAQERVKYKVAALFCCLCFGGRNVCCCSGEQGKGIDTDDASVGVEMQNPMSVFEADC